MVGKTILHYKIIKKLGQGGMGVVYLADDTKLERQVAIKFLPQHISANSDERKRFEIEAKAAAALNHPNIATIYAIEEADDQLFLVMEYIEGRELKDIVNNTQSLPLASGEEKGGVLNIAVQMAEGLQAAHEKGITHRDIKSSNIMVTDKGKVKIMDFGLAKYRGSGQLTRIGTTLGTAAYMSPEQARGEDADQRSDIWSFGVILYELLSGEMPFKGAYEAAIMFSIINDHADMQLLQKPDISADFISIVIKCLEKDKEQRYQSMDQVLDDLNAMNTSSSQISSVFSESKPAVDNKAKSKFAIPKWILPALGIISIIVIIFFLFRPASEKPSDTTKMLAVLPFQNLGNIEDEYFADGITGEIISKLSGLSNLRVIARSSVMQYKNSKKSLKQIGEELGVQFILEGTIQWELTENGRKRIRVNPELIKIQNYTQIWSNPYESDFSSAFTLQSEIASRVANALNLKLAGNEQQSLQSNITNSSEAYDLYLKARYYAQDISNEKNHRIAAEILEKAIELDNQFAEAYAELSTVQSNMYWSYFDRSDEILVKSEKNAQKALSINNNLPEAHVAMGDFFYHGLLDYKKALEEYDKALKINPNHLYAVSGIAYVSRRKGDMHKTIDYLMKAYELNPKDYDTVFSIGETYCLLRDYDLAVSFLNKVSLISPEAIHPYFTRGLSFILKNGDVKKCRDDINKAQMNKIGLDSHLYINVLYLCDLLDGDFKSAIERVKGIKEIDDQFFYKPEDLYLAEIYGLAGDTNQMEKHYRAAVEVLKKKITAEPEDSRLYTSLGIAYAGLGEKDLALKEGKFGYELLPVTKEAWRGTYRLFDLAQIYTMTGDKKLAVKTLDKILSLPTDVISVALLKIDPRWNSLKNDTGFQQIISKYSDETLTRN